MTAEVDVRNCNWLIDYFEEVHRERHDKSFAFVLGSGTSTSSGIPTGASLVGRWLAEIQKTQIGYDKNTAISLDSWATPENLRIEGFNYIRAAEFYADVFEARFKADPEEGYFQLEQLMENKVPEIGYVILAEILSTTRHRVVVTTNFDNLVTDAISIYSRKNALVCGHESLAQFARVNTRRPLIAKVHRDVLLAPGNTRNVLERVTQAWKDVLHKLFAFYTPIVIGYGGNDGSLMKVLEGLNPTNQSRPMIWCYYEPDGTPSERIRLLIRQQKGILIPIRGFDELMIAIANKVQIRMDHLPDKIVFLAQQRANSIRKSLHGFGIHGSCSPNELSSCITPPSSPSDPPHPDAELGH